jgi:hypothetical protein
MKFLKHVLFFLSDVLLQRYDSASFGLILKKKAFSHSRQLYTVTQGGQGLTDPCFLDLNQHLWDGRGFKDPCLF